MKHILSKREVDVLAQLAWSRVLLAFDFDGTLAPIVGDRDAAGMRARTRDLFRRVCELYPCAVISGRSRDDVARRLGGAPVQFVIGNHGLEPGNDIDRFARQMAEIRPSLEESLREVPGVEIEDKEYSLAVHYRRSRRREEAREAIARAVEALPVNMRSVGGKLVVNLLPADAPHKGDALVRLLRERAADTALYVGDDLTDEDVFELDLPGRLVTIRVGASRRSAAGYFVRDQAEVDALLVTLAGLRTKHGQRALAEEGHR